MPTFAGRLSTMNLFFHWIFHRILWVDSQQQILDKLIPHTFNVFMLEDEIQKPGGHLFRYSSEAMLWIKEVEMVDSLDVLRDQ